MSNLKELLAKICWVDIFWWRVRGRECPVSVFWVNGIHWFLLFVSLLRWVPKHPEVEGLFFLKFFTSSGPFMEPNLILGFAVLRESQGPLWHPWAGEVRPPHVQPCLLITEWHTVEGHSLLFLSTKRTGLWVVLQLFCCYPESEVCIKRNPEIQIKESIPAAPLPSLKPRQAVFSAHSRAVSSCSLAGAG